MNLTQTAPGDEAGERVAMKGPKSSGLPVARPSSLATKLVLSLVLAAGFVWVLRRGGLPLLPAESAFDAVRWWLGPVYILLCCLGFFLRTYRWVYLLRPLAEKIS